MLIYHRYVLEKGGNFKPISIEEIERQIEKEYSVQNETNNTQNKTSNNSSRNNSTPNTPRDNIANINNLFAFPAQCNFSGRKFPMSIIDHFQHSKTLNQHGK